MKTIPTDRPVPTVTAQHCAIEIYERVARSILHAPENPAEVQRAAAWEIQEHAIDPAIKRTRETIAHLLSELFQPGAHYAIVRDANDVSVPINKLQALNNLITSLSA